MGYLPAVLAAASARPSPRCWAPARARAPGPWPPTTRTPPPWASRPAAGPWPLGPALPEDLLFSTPAPGYLDKTSATTLHAALGLDRACAAYDFCGAPRSALGSPADGAAGRAVPPDTGRGLRPPDRPGRRGRRARRRGRRGGLPVRRRRGRGRAGRAGLGQRRVPRSLAGPRGDGLPRLGGALRRGDVRPAGPRGVCRRPEGRRVPPRATSTTPSWPGCTCGRSRR